MRTLITILFISLSTLAWSQSDTIRADNNAGVQSKSIAYESAKEKEARETTLPNLEVTAGVFVKPMVLPMGNQVAQFSAMQMFPWFGTYESIREEARAMEDVAFQQYIAERNAVILQVNISKLSLYNIRKKAELELERLRLLKAIEDFQLAKYSTGGNSSGNTGMGMSNSTSPVTGMSQLLLTRIEIKTLENELKTLRDDFGLESIRHNLLLNTDRLDPIEVPDTLGFFPAPIITSFENSPMIKMVEAEKRAAMASEQMVGKMGAPMIGVGLNYMMMQKPSGGDFPMADGKDMIMPMVSVSLPVYRKKYTALKKEARLNQSSLEKKREQMLNDLWLEYEEAQQMKNVAGRNYQLAVEQTTLAENTVALMLTEYTSNKTSYDEILRMKSQVLMLKIETLEALVEYNMAISKLEYIVNSY